MTANERSSSGKRLRGRLGGKIICELLCMSGCRLHDESGNFGGHACAEVLLIVCPFRPSPRSGGGQLDQIERTDRVSVCPAGVAAGETGKTTGGKGDGEQELARHTFCTGHPVLLCMCMLCACRAEERIHPSSVSEHASLVPSVYQMYSLWTSMHYGDERSVRLCLLSGNTV